MNNSPWFETNVILLIILFKFYIIFFHFHYTHLYLIILSWSYFAWLSMYTFWYPVIWFDGSIYYFSFITFLIQLTFLSLLSCFSFSIEFLVSFSQSMYWEGNLLNGVDLPEKPQFWWGLKYSELHLALGGGCPRGGFAMYQNCKYSFMWKKYNDPISM